MQSGGRTIDSRDMLTRLCRETLLVDDEAADAVWQFWSDGDIGDFMAAAAWWTIAVHQEAMGV